MLCRGTFNATASALNERMNELHEWLVFTHFETLQITEMNKIDNHINEKISTILIASS